MGNEDYHTVRTSKNKVLANVINNALSSQDALLYACAIDEQGITPEDESLYVAGRQEIELQAPTFGPERPQKNALSHEKLAPYFESSMAREKRELNTDSTKQFSEYLIEGIRDSLQYENFTGVKVFADVIKASSGSASSTYEFSASFNESVEGTVFPVTCKYSYEQDHNDHEDSPQSVTREFLDFQKDEVRSAFWGELELSVLDSSINGNTLVVQLNESANP